MTRRDADKWLLLLMAALPSLTCTLIAHRSLFIRVENDRHWLLTDLHTDQEARDFIARALALGVENL